MSASTVSITANPASARRRPVLLADKKSNHPNIELFPAENGANADDRANVSGNSKDLSHHSIRGGGGEAKDLAAVKKALGNSTISPRRARKVAPRAEKPRWLTVVSVFGKNFVLLVVLLGLVQLVRRLSMSSPESAVEFTDFEGRIAEVEGLLKKTSKMIQVQVDVVDKKLENEIGGLRKELSKRIEDRSLMMRTDLKKLEAKTEVMEKSLSELKEGNWLSKQEFEKFVEEFMKGKGVVGDQSDVSLDAVKAYARDVVLKEIEKHAADGLGRVDYALSFGGGMVVKHSEPYLVGKRSIWSTISNRHDFHSDADKMLKPSFGEPGQCFPLKGSSGYVQVRLRTKIVPEAVTLEHVAKSVAYDRSSAPKDCRVSGWLHQGHADSAAVDTEKMFLLAEFMYDLEKSNAQTFNVMDSTASGLIDTVRLDFTSNHGSPTHTCIYRLRVHGHEPESEALLAVQS
ncbi:SUN domain-containing protein 1-like [Syzygium oleosum]|uniref:SUN domain-containing protein 1-like n=1 Tax=Syzygium oleosum TaxID=219896 RepID=UPI0011D2642E|nr:SUN domain-containing protein 1-like [Syzygium oleosum]